MVLSPYLHFAGTCEEALHFYADVFGGKIVSLNRFEGSPLMSNLPAELGSKIMHATFEAPTLTFMASDSPSHSHREGDNNVTLSLASKDPIESERIFHRLADGGTVAMPFQDTFWGARFGMLTDRYGIEWMVNCDTSGH